MLIQLFNPVRVDNKKSKQKLPANDQPTKQENRNG